MALTKPILLTRPAFDATLDAIFAFNVPSGGDQVTKNRLTIINQSTGVQVYQGTQTTFALAHTLASSVLTNGTYYSAYINTFNASNEMSVNSNTIQFYCYTTPSFAFSNLPSGNIIANNSFSFQVTYNQTEGELLNSYKFDLYDAQNVIIATSGVKYVGSSIAPPTVITYEFGGFPDNTAYYIRCSGVTIESTEIQTLLTAFTVKYIQPNIFAIVELTQNCTGGYVTVKSNMTNIEGTSNPNPPTYINNEAVDLTASGSWVNWNQNQFNFSDDWTLNLFGKNFTSDSNIVVMQNNLGDTLTLTYRQGYYQDGNTLQTYVDCTVKSGTAIYYIFSNYIDNPLTTDSIQIWLRRINNIYQLNIYNLP